MRNFFEHTSLHGFRFIAEEERHSFERFLWTILCIISWIWSAVLFEESYMAFQDNAVSYGVETMFLETNTSFPSVSVCEDEDPDVLYQRANELYGEDHDRNLEEVLGELAYFKGSAYYLKSFCKSNDIDCPKRNFSELARKVRRSCEEVLLRCLWDWEPVDCCDHFVPIETELGTCFSLSDRNEKVLKDKGEFWVDKDINIRRGELPSVLLTIKRTAKIYLHSEHEVPYLNHPSSDILTVDPTQEKHYRITITGIDNDPEVRELSVYQRKCRFPDENYMKSADFYSYSSCIVDCRRRAQMELCNCTSHFTPKSKPEEHCDYDGILCLDAHYSYLSVPRKNGLECNCLPGCADTEFDVPFSIDKEIPPGLIRPYENNSDTLIMLVRFPTERYRRVVVRGMLDLVVSIGGTAGLFVGASLLTIVEVTYYFLFRARATNELKDSEDKHEEKEKTRPENTAEGILPTVLEI
ncbi:Amiloride-sensitive sodium channel [Nesidiocoris tenuis]|uniref:Amiloride-sensitive sodium channel n=1 Tax=Nesidiocoris tenuis TaxID=355587 RepID=A0ABN7AW67_9HEMI|nr:Amiloride-sensitive sodium channel [Nesidiocoris tenuis]